MALRYAFLLFAVVLTLASGFRLKNPDHVYPKGDPLEKSLAHQQLSNTKLFCGETAEQGRSIYQALLAIQDSAVSFSYDSGAVISNNYILTSAQNVAAFENQPSKITAVVGTVYYSGIPGSEQKLTVSSVIIHPQFDSVTSENNIALLQTQEIMIFGANVQPVRVPKEGSSVPSSGYHSGWSQAIVGDFIQFTLKYKEVSVIGDSECKAIAGVPDDNFCVDNSNGLFSCTGEDGAPYVADNIIRGIQSKITTANTENMYFTSVSVHAPWINEISGMKPELEMRRV